MEEVKQCYTLNSTPSSQTKTVGKSGKQKRVLNMSTRRLHGKFMAASGYELSLSLFRKFRPKNILLVEANCFRTATSVPDLKVVKWKQWKTDPTLNKKIQTICVGTVNQLIDETCQDIASFSSHVHTAEWQKDQCKYLHNYLPSGYILSVQDFA